MSSTIFIARRAVVPAERTDGRSDNASDAEQQRRLYELLSLCPDRDDLAASVPVHRRREAHSIEFSEDAYERASEPKELVIIPGAGHVDLYDRVNLIPFDKLTEFFRGNLS